MNSRQSGQISLSYRGCLAVLFNLEHPAYWQQFKLCHSGWYLPKITVQQIKVDICNLNDKNAPTKLSMNFHHLIQVELNNSSSSFFCR